MRVLRAVLLTIVLAMVATPTWAQGVLEQLRERPKPEVVCKRFETALEMRDWRVSEMRGVVMEFPSDRADLTEAALQTLGGARLVMAVDTAALRKDMVEQGREDVRRIARDQRLGSPSAVIIRGDAIEFRPRDGIDPAKTSEAFATLTSGPFAPLASPNVADQIAANGLVTFVVPDRAVKQQQHRRLQASIRFMKDRLRMLGTEAPLVRDLGDGRILVLIPGLRDPNQLLQLVPSWPKLTIRQVDRLADPCNPSGLASSDAEIVWSVGRTGALVVQNRIVAGEDVTAAVVVRTSGADEYAVVLHFSMNGARHLVEFAKNNVGQALAFILDFEIIAAPVIAEPITRTAVMLSGGLKREQARDLVRLVEATALPAPLTVVEKQVIDPKPQ
jgi:SecD/SecF fusion protein